MSNKFLTLSIVLLMCLCIAFLFISCGRGNEDDGKDTLAESDTAYVSETMPVITEKETEAIETEQLESEPYEELRIPVENEKAIAFIEDRFAKALAAIDIAKNGALKTDIKTEIVTEEGRIYFPISDSEARPELEGGSIVTFEDLSKYIKSIFARSIADDLLDIAKTHYIEIEGVLCREAEYIDTEPSVETGETDAEPESEDAAEEESEDESSDNAEEDKPLVVESTEFFLSDFTDKLFRYTAKVTYEETDQADYYDYIFENTGSGWYWTAFPSIPA